MPTSEKHLEQYRANRKLIGQLQALDPIPFDWVVTLTFYSAIHLVERVLADKGHHTKEHKARQGLVGAIQELKSIRHQYTALEWDSRQARYDCIKFSAKKAQSSLDKLKYIEEQLLSDCS